MGGLVAGFGIFVALALLMPNVVLVGIVLSIGIAMARAPFTVVFATTAAVLPYRLRSRGTAMVGVYLFCFGGFFGAVLTGVLSDAIGRQAAVIAVVLPSSLIGGALMAYGGRYIRGDISRCVEELQEEQEELARRHGADGEVPVIQVRNLDFAYGTVQVLHDVALDVHRGETVALLGTNGAGKSTLLRVISGLGVPLRGVVRLNGRTVTYADPEVRVKIGIVQLMGGRATFPSLSVRENLRMAGYLYRGADLEARVDAALARFPVLADGRTPGPATSPAASNRCWPWPWRWSTSPKCWSSTSCPRPGPDRRPGAADHGPGAQGPGPDHDHRRAVAEHGPGPGRPGPVHGEGRGPLRRPHRRPGGPDDLARAVFLGGTTP